MGDKSKIEWLDGGATWNPAIGCTPAGAGCRNCYAARMAARLARMDATRDDYADLTAPAVGSGVGSQWTGAITLRTLELDKPSTWKRPRRVFVCSMGDLFHRNVPDAWIVAVCASMCHAPQHEYVFLTKRPARLAVAAATLNVPAFASMRVLFGASASTQEEAYYAACALSDVAHGAACSGQRLRTWLSLEPLLDCWSLNDVAANASSWVVVGEETGPGARPCDPRNVRRIVGDCQRHGIPVFVKKCAGLDPSEIVRQWPTWGEHGRG